MRTLRYPEEFAAVRALWEAAGEGIALRASDEAAEIEKKLNRDPELFLVAEYRKRIVGAAMGGPSEVMPSLPPHVLTGSAYAGAANRTEATKQAHAVRNATAEQRTTWKRRPLARPALGDALGGATDP